MIERIRNLNRASILDLPYKIKEAAVVSEKEGCRRKRVGNEQSGNK
jgi:hypothetical protein